MTAEEQERLVAVSEAHANAVSLHETDYGLTTTLFHGMPTGDVRPVQQWYQHVPTALYQEIKEMLKKFKKSILFNHHFEPLLNHHPDGLV